MWSIDNSRRDGPSPSVTVITEEKRLGGSSSGAIVVRNRLKFQRPWLSVSSAPRLISTACCLLLSNGSKSDFIRFSIIRSRVAGEGKKGERFEGIHAHPESPCEWANSRARTGEPEFTYFRISENVTHPVGWCRYFGRRGL